MLSLKSVLRRMGLWLIWLGRLFEFSCVRERDSPPENSSPRHSWITVKLEWQSKMLFLFYFETMRASLFRYGKSTELT
jgi:hypothetical protein